MSEHLQSREKLLSTEWQNLMTVVNEFLDVSDKEFIQGLDLDQALGFVYGRLMNDGYDVDAVFEAGGITQNEV
ncbi:MAG TPA: hypothetical protein VIM37_04305 [Candidatus Microsaccharimonas sp.]|jgi:hypothetical protein